MAVLDTSGLHHLLGFGLTLADVAARRVFQQHIGVPFELRPVEFTVLVLLNGNVQATSRQLAQTLDMPPPNITVLVDRLVVRGLVQRRRSDSDRRATHLLLSPAGASLARRCLRVSQTMERDWLAPLSPAERAMLGELLHKLVHKHS
jgi:DNA-binding MarR family transcriptional regulator